MKKLSLDQIENINGGTNPSRLVGCALMGLGAS